jgi:hypothetical protein
MDQDDCDSTYERRRDFSLRRYTQISPSTHTHYYAMDNWSREAEFEADDSPKI